MFLVNMFDLNPSLFKIVIIAEGENINSKIESDLKKRDSVVILIK